MPIVLDIALLAILLWLSVVDFRTYRLPDIGTLSLIAIGLFIAWQGSGLEALGNSLASASIGFFCFAAISYGYRALRGQDGLGLGDAKLLAAAGAWLGWMLLPLVVLIGALLALVYISVLQLLGRPVSMGMRVPFGPFLSVGFYSCWLLQKTGMVPLIW